MVLVGRLHKGQRVLNGETFDSPHLTFTLTFTLVQPHQFLCFLFLVVCLVELSVFDSTCVHQLRPTLGSIHKDQKGSEWKII